MANIVCPECGYENPEGSTVCEICAESLLPASSGNSPVVSAAPIVPPASVPVSAPQNPAYVPTVAQSAISQAENQEYFVLCPQSQTKTVLPNGDVTKFFCEGCQEEHTIDGFLWSIERREKETSPVLAGAPAAQPEASRGDNLWLEEVNTHFRIDIAKEGGTLGRYGTFGAAFFQTNHLLMVSGEHCRITYEYGSWVLRHISRTNQTQYNGMTLGANEPNLLEDGRILTLANAVSFIVRIG